MDQQTPTGGEPIDETWWDTILNSSMSRQLENAELPPDQSVAATNTIDWNYVLDIYQKDKVIATDVFGFNRGGILVRNEKMQGFVPGSHLVSIQHNNAHSSHPACLSSYIGKKINVKIIECSQENERIVLSERAAAAGEGSRTRLLAELHVNDIVSGIVTNITSFGLFVDLGGIEGLVHVSELSWGRVIEPAKLFSLGQEVSVLVLSIDALDVRIALSIKRLQPNPWTALVEKYRPGDRLSATVSAITKYGIFAQLQEGVEGLMHISAFGEGMTWEKLKLEYKVGQTIIACILRIDAENHRLGLGPVEQP